jgi:adhesin/invasin
MRSLSRRLLTLYLVFCVALSPLFPSLTFAQPDDALVQQLSLPQLGNAGTATTPEPRLHDQLSNASDTDSGGRRDRSQGVDEAMAQAAGALSGAASGASERWFSSHGITSALAVGAGRHGVKGGSLDVLVPFYNAGTHLVFTQAGIRRANTYTETYRTTTNLGLGYRHDVGDWLLGLNSFYDRDHTGKNDRLGAGLEAWTDFFKLSANTYQPLSNWKASPDLLDRLERPAKGWDLRTEGYLPTYPQLGAKLTYEQYYGDAVALFAGGDRQKNPNATTVGILYNPVPLVGLNLNHRLGHGGQADTSANLSLTYRLGEPLAKQLSSDNLMASRMRERLRYDLVSRNNEIVLDARQDLVQLGLAAVISGTENTSVPLQLTGAESLQSLSWTGTAAGFVSAQARSTRTLLNLPAYTGDNDTYSLQAVGIDRAGRTVTSNLMTVIVLSVGITVTASPTSIQANGTDSTTLSATVSDAQGNPVAAGVNVAWTTTAGQLAGSSSTTGSNGIATMVLTSPIQAGTAKVQATANTATHTAVITFTAGAPNDVQLSATPAAITADGSSTSTLRATVNDAHGNSLEGVTVNWSSSAGSLASPTSVTDGNGVATVVLISPTTAGSATVQASANTATASIRVTFAAGEPARIAITPTNATIIANGTSRVTLNANVEDAHGNLVGAGIPVTWSTSAGTFASSSSTTNANGVATIELISATLAGLATVQARSGQVNDSTTVTFSADVPAVISLSADSATLVADGVSTATLSARVDDASGNSVGAGVVVNWSADAGKLSSLSSTTNDSGVATVVLTSSTTAQAANVSASSGAASESTSVVFVAGAPALITLEASPADIIANGTDTSTLSATLKDAHGNLVDSGVEVTWSSSAGSLSSPTSTTNAGGVATVALKSSATSEIATVIATADSASASATVKFEALPPVITLVVGAASTNPSGSTTYALTATVSDADGNAISGEVVNWTASSGSLSNRTSSTDDQGVASNRITGSKSLGTTTVQVSIGAVTASATVYWW